MPPLRVEPTPWAHTPYAQALPFAPRRYVAMSFFQLPLRSVLFLDFISENCTKIVEATLSPLQHVHKILPLAMYWTLELAQYLEDAPWPASRDELIDYALRSGAPLEVIENLQEMEDEGELYEGLEDIWPDYPRKDDFLFNEDEY